MKETKNVFMSELTEVFSKRQQQFVQFAYSYVRNREEAEISGPQVFYYGSSEMSKKLAETIQAQLIVDLQPPKEREIKTGNDLYILKNSQCPGVIVECGFLSNPTECENLQNPQYQQAVAAAIARAICKL